MPARPKAIIIVGMHRSGTSLIAKTARTLGVYMGLEEQMIHPREDNPEGFWEHSAIVDVHERLLARLHRTWDTTLPLPDGWWLSAEVASFREELKEIAAACFAERPLWGFKDPRACLLLPMWKTVFDELHIDAAYIVCSRNPLNVAASLHKRDGFAHPKSFALWTLYMLSALYHTNSERRIVVGYDAVMDRPMEAAGRIGRFIGVPADTNGQAAADSIPNQALRHGNFSADDLWQTDSAPSIVKRLYRICLDGEANDDVLNSGEGEITDMYETLRETALLMNHQRSYRMQIYWGGADGHFAEGKSTYITTEPSRETILYTADIKEDIGSMLRIDPPGPYGYVKITGLTLLCDSGETDLLQSGHIEYADFIEWNRSAGASSAIEGVGSGSGVSPQLLIGGLPSLNGNGHAKLLIEMSFSFVMNSEIAGMLNYRRIADDRQRQLEQLEILLEEKELTITLTAGQLERQLETLEALHADWEERGKAIAARNDELRRLRAEKTDPGGRSGGAAASGRAQSLLVRAKDQEIERYRREIELYSASLSWRITLPVRWLGEAARKAKRRLKRLAKGSLQWYFIQRHRHRQSAGLPGKLGFREYALVVSHTHYLESMGGTEKYIFEQAGYLARKGIGIIQIYPGKSYSLTETKDETYYGVVVEDQFKGFFPIADIGSWIAQRDIRLASLYTHHLLNWQMKDYEHLIRRVKEQRTIRHTLFMHDFFMVCSSYHMMYEPTPAVSLKQASERRSCIPEITASPGVEPNICLSCKHGSRLPEWRQAARSVMEQADHLVVPSHFVGETALAVYPDMLNKLLVRSHLTFANQKIVHKAKPERRKIRIAYVGYKMDNKGWPLWERLYNDELLRAEYEFHHIGSQEDYSGHVVMHRYSFVKDGRMAAVHLLADHDIDLALLWSVVPESYSYTLQESIAAGVPVLTSPKSGNIAATIDLHPELGKVLRSEEQLRDFLADAEAVRGYVSGDKARYELRYNHLPFD